jgi:hypothetical protein
MLESLLYLKRFTEKQLLKLHGYKRCNENCFRVIVQLQLQMNWACTIGGGIGYAQFGGSSSTDGVVIDSKYLEQQVQQPFLQLRKNSNS